MTKEEKIKEVMECVNILTNSVYMAAVCAENGGIDLQDRMNEQVKARRDLEKKLRELIN